MIDKAQNGVSEPKNDLLKQNYHQIFFLKNIFFRQIRKIKW